MRLLALSLGVLLSVGSVGAQAVPARATPMPRLVEKDGRHALLVDGKPYLMLGAQVNNSSAWPAMLPKVWPAVERLHANTVEAPIYWEQWEPTEGHFDASVLHVLLAQAREHHVHLVLLWFGTWKNGSGHYTPPFIKLDEARVPHVVGRDGRKVDSLSPFSQVAMDGDRRAFTALLKELKASDPQHTVLMVQVENEIGAYGTIRDYSPAAEKLFAGQVPAELVKALHKSAGTWSEVFGGEADESFYAWSIARFVEQIAAAGKAVNPLPLYINVATRNPINGRPGSYPSGGAVDGMIPIWKAGAPSIDVFGIDLYDGNYEVYTKLLDIYKRADNATFVPETSNNAAFARYLYTALGHGAIGFSPFGFDETGYVNFPLGASRIDEAATAPFALEFAAFAPMEGEIARLNFEGKVQGVSEDRKTAYQTMDFGGWKVAVTYGLPQFGSGDNKGAKGNSPVSGGALVAQLGANEFLVTAVHARVNFTPAEAGKQMQFVRVEEGAYDKGVWKMTRVWNGDQTDYGINFTSGSQVLRVTLATY